MGSNRGVTVFGNYNKRKHQLFFFPHRYKSLEELIQSGIKVTQDTFPNKTALNEDGGW